MTKPQITPANDAVAQPTFREEQDRGAAGRIYQMLRDAGETGIENLDPANYPSGGESKDIDPWLAALDRLTGLAQAQEALLARLETIVRRLDAQEAAKRARGVPRPLESGVIETPQQDVGAVWAQGLKERPIGTS
jgi:hypothetical protein